MPQPKDLPEHVLRNSKLARATEERLETTVEIFIDDVSEFNPTNPLVQEVNQLCKTFDELQKEVLDLVEKKSSILTAHLKYEDGRKDVDDCRAFHGKIASSMRNISFEQRVELKRLEKDVDREKKSVESYLFALERAYLPSVKTTDRATQMVRNVKLITNGMIDKLWTEYQSIIR